MPRGAARLRTSEGKFNQVGERVRNQRRTLKLSQDSLCARLADVTKGEWNPGRPDILRIEDGLRSVHDTEILALAKALEVNACWLLLGGTEEMSPDKSSRMGS